MESRGLHPQHQDSVVPLAGRGPQGVHGVHDTLRGGIAGTVQSQVLGAHALELPEKNFQANRERLRLATLRSEQGLHAPLRLQMELRASERAGQRLAFLPSSHVARDTLRGTDESIGFEDFLNDPEQSEKMGEPHVMVEHKLGLL